MGAKFIFVTGGVCSSLGKGIAAASIGLLLKLSGLKIFVIKMDPYLNIDPGTMNPAQHGEVFVTDDGAETDLDLGHYERILGQPLSRLSSVSAGQIRAEVTAEERNGKFLGATIQIVPHITDAIKNKIFQAAEISGADVAIVEIGGTVGDIEGKEFLEAIRQIRFSLEHNQTLSVHLGLIPFLESSKEFKTKPTQHSIRILQEHGIFPDIILTRFDKKRISPDLLEKIAKFAGIEPEAVAPAPTVDSIYEVPLSFNKTKIINIIGQKLSLGKLEPNLEEWQTLVKTIKTAEEEIKIAMVGKYFDKGADVYISVVEAIKHACWSHNRRPAIDYINSEDIENGDFNVNWLEKYSGVIVPGGFGERGVEGIISAIKFCRENNMPFLGICYGMQLAAVEFARNICGLKDANTSEINPKTQYPVIDLMDEQKGISRKGATMRLGAYQSVLEEDSISRRCYGKDIISERHRHRYEFNNHYRKELKKRGLVIAGTSPDEVLVEIIELSEKTHPFFVGVQFHPEFQSRPLEPHPLFQKFIEKSLERKTKDEKR